MFTFLTPFWLIASVTVPILWLMFRLGTSRRELRLPVETPGSGPSAIFEAVQENYKKYPNTPYLLNVARPIVILPAQCIDDIKHLPEEKASLYDEVHVDLSQAVTGIGGGGDSPESIPTIRIDLTRRLNNTVDAMVDELRYAMSIEFGGEDEAADWKTHALHPKISKVVALMNWRIFLGRPLSRSTEWLTHALGYSIDVMRARHALNKYPYYLRFVIGRFTPEVRRLRWHATHGAKLLRPIVEELLLSKRQQEAMSQSQHDRKLEPERIVADDEFQDQQGTFCSWLLKYAVGSRDTTEILILNLLALSFVSTHTIAYCASRALFDLAAHPEYIKELRDEIEQVFREDGHDLDAHGQRVLRKTSYVKLRKIDSFLKESQRLFPSKFVGMVRISRSPISLSTGHQLPAGTRFGVPVYAVHTAGGVMNNKTGNLGSNHLGIQDKPLSEFDGLRYYKMRQLPGNDAKYQFGTSSNDSLAFGLGVHCCPGRFYASMVVKVIFVEILRFWDVRMRGDEAGKGGDTPKLNFMDFSIGANPNEMIEIRRRAVREQEK